MASRTSFTSWILLCLLCFRLWWTGEPRVGRSVQLLQGLCLLYCLGSCYWTHCVFPVHFGPYGIHLPWQRIRNFHCILIWGKDLNVLCLQKTNLVQVHGPVIFAQFLLHFVFSLFSCIKEYRRQAFLSFCGALFFIPAVVCALLTHMQCCACARVLCHMYAWSLPTGYQYIFCIPMSSLLDQSVGSVLSTACAFSWPNCSWVPEYQLSLAVVAYEHGDPECLFSVWHWK